MNPHSLNASHLGLAGAALSLLLGSMSVTAAETLFPSGPHEFEGRPYYWLAEWRLEVTLPDDVAPGDRLAVLFGTKGADKRTLHYQYGDRAGSLAEARSTAYDWIELPLGQLSAGKPLLLFGKGEKAVAFLWADREIATLLVDHTNSNRLWGVHKLEANTVRTVLIHTMLHTRNTLLRPWQQGLRLGASPCGDGICVFLTTNESYEGKLVFDVPRHRITMGFEQDWPRMNAVPEWFTVEPDAAHQYEVRDVDSDAGQVVSGKELSEGLPIRLDPGKPRRLVISHRR